MDEIIEIAAEIALPALAAVAATAATAVAGYFGHKMFKKHQEQKLIAATAASTEYEEAGFDSRFAPREA